MFFEPAAQSFPGDERPLQLGWKDLLSMGALFAFAFWTQRWVLDLSLTAIDTIPTLAAAKVDSWVDTFNVLLRELRGGADDNYYYRPLTLLSYTLDQHLWKGTAFGYHLTDVVLHSLAGATVYALARLAFDLPRVASAGMAVLFLIHPAVLEVVPAISRRQEPLLVMGFCLSLMGARRVPERVGWLLILLGSLISVSSVERGLAVPLVVFSYLFFYRYASLDLLSRGLSSVRWALPSVAVAAAFLLLRNAMFGAAATTLQIKHLVYVPTHFGLSLIYPQQIIDLVVPGSAAEALLLLLALGILGLAFGLPLLRSSRRALVWCGLSWIASFVILLSIAGFLNAWYVYTGVPGLELIVVFYATEARRQFKQPPPGKFIGVLAAAAALLTTLAFSVSSPVFREYPGWSIAADLSERFLNELARVSAQIPEDESLLILNMPAHYRESDSDNLVTASAAILWPSSVEVWRQERGSAHEITMLGSVDVVGEMSIPHIENREDEILVYFKEGHSTYTNSNGTWPEATRLPPEIGRGFRFPWTPQSRPGPSTHVFLFDGTRLNPYSF